MLSEEQITALRHQVANAIADELTRANVDWAYLDQLIEPSVSIEVEFQSRSEDGSHTNRSPVPGFTISRVIDLTNVISPRPSSAPEDEASRRADRSPSQSVAPSSGVIVPLSHEEPRAASDDGHDHSPHEKGQLDPEKEENNTPDDEDDDISSRVAISSLRPSRHDAPVVEDNTQRHMEVRNESFPKRRKAEAVGYTMKPSTLDKLVTGIWERLFNGMNIDPVEVLGQFMAPRPLENTAAAQLLQDAPGMSLSHPGPSNSPSTDRQFSDTTVFCRKVTQASRTCRSVELIVQARWVEHFDAYVEYLTASDPKTSSTKHRKTALVEASSSFGWAEKEMRNRMAIWRGYKEIKDAGGWAALVFAGMGIYRFCKYRIGFDNESMQRLRNLRPALEVAADTMNPNWRRLLPIIGESPERLYGGHPHDWVVSLVGSTPLELRQTYLHWDPNFEYLHIEECVIDQAAWGSDDPRWTPPSSKARTLVSGLFSCQICTGEQSDDPNRNQCYCFPSLFGCAAPTLAPVQVFRTPDGRNNGLMALCSFARGAAIGEFVGVITKGLQDVDVMENNAGSTIYQIWQGRQGNFTRFVNHSCKANAQYQQFIWLDTQRIILVSKGISAGSEITVDYSGKYWKGLDKKCLCGEKSCRYKDK